MTYEPSVTATDAPPSARIEFASLAAGTERVTVWRQFDGLTTSVRRGLNKFAAGGFVTVDDEVPAGTEVTYYATMFDDDGEKIADTDGTSVTVAAGQDPTIAWFSDPLVEGSAIAVEMAATAGTKPSRPMVGQTYQIGMRTVVLNSRQSDIVDLNMDFFTADTSTRDRIQQLLAATNGLILIRTAPPMMVPRMLYCWAQNAVPDDFSLPLGVEDVAWDNKVQQVSEVEGDTSVVAVTWQTYIDAFPTWADMKAAYSSWFDAMKNPPA